MKRTIVAMPGDGIGKTVFPEAIRVFNSVGFDAELFTEISAGIFGVAKVMHFLSAP